MQQIKPLRVSINQHNTIELSPGVEHLHELLEQLSIDTSHVAVAVNNHIINQDMWLLHVLKDNDQISVFGAIAGG